MKRLSLEEIKQIELNMLIDLKKICDDNGLTLYLVGGTLLGAIRHGGFIPWDDDIDVGLKRPDYDRLIKIINEKHLFSEDIRMVCYENGDFSYPYMKLFNTATRIERMFLGDSKNIWIDILPIDGLPENQSVCKKIYNKNKRMRKILFLSNANPGEGKTKLKAYLKKNVIPIVRTLLMKRAADIIYNNVEKYPYEEENCCGVVTWGLYGINEKMKKEEFEKTEKVTFEGVTFDIMSCWDYYLTNLYGEYMQLPAEEDRITHDMVAYK